jgi:UPF0716 protein FxsA
MIWKLGLLFTIVPLVETYVLIKVGSVIGPLPTVLLLLLDGLLGAWLAKREGMGIVRQLTTDLGKGLPPATHLVEGLLIIVGAVLLVTPGFTTDIVGFFLLFPPTRRLAAPYVLRAILRRFNIEGVRIGPAGPIEPEPMHTPASERAGTPFDHPVR